MQLEGVGDSFPEVARLRRILAVLVAGLAVSLVLAGCGGSGSGTADAADDGRPLVVTTVSPITSIAANVIGDLARIRGIVPEGTNSHTFQPPPSASEVLERADVVLANGLQLEEPTLNLARKVGDARIVELGDLIVSPDQYVYDFSFPKDEGKPNPHLWTDPTLATQYARHIADTMAEVDPDHADAYRANARAYEQQLDAFDTALRTALDTVPEQNRKLVTYHDAYGYWARTYGWKIVGAAQPNSFGDPSPKAVAALIDQIKAERVPAIFGSEVFPSSVLEQVAAETGARYVADLRDDDLPGAPGDPDHSYLGLMKFDYVTIVEALGGDAAALRAFEPPDTSAGDVEYPQ